MRKYAMGKYNPNGTRKIKSKPIKSHMGRKRKNNRDKVMAMAIVIWMMSSALISFAESGNEFTITPRQGQQATSDATDDNLQADETDYSGIPYMSREQLPVKDQIRLLAEAECSKLKLGGMCVQDTLGIAWTESRFDCSVIGDEGNSYGCFQIYRQAHPEVTVKQAQDVEFATRWTVNNLAEHGYTTNRDRAVMKHNGTPYTAKTLAYLTSVKSYK